MKKILLLVTVLVFTAALFGCKKNNSDNNVLTVGLNAEFPPFEYIEQGEIVGFDIDLMNEISKIINKEVKYQHMAFDGLLMAMQTGKIDIIVSGMTATEERRKNVLFSDPYFTSKQAVIVQENSNITNFSQLEGKKIGVVLGFTGDTAVTAEYTGKAEILRFDAAPQLVLALTSNKVDALVIDYEPAKEYIANNKGLKLLDTPLAVEEYSIALPKDKEQLLNDINKAIATLKSNGVYDNLYKKYFNKEQ